MYVGGYVMGGNVCACEQACLPAGGKGGAGACTHAPARVFVYLVHGRKLVVTITVGMCACVCALVRVCTWSVVVNS